jgi:hypothetical protein
MMKRRLRPQGRITRNTVTPDEVAERARELALISGRAPNRRTASDLRDAKRELLGDESADAPADEPHRPASGMGAPPTSSGRRVRRHLPTDDRDEERTVQEGVDEAEHSEMLEAAKRPTRNEK